MTVVPAQLSAADVDGHDRLREALAALTRVCEAGARGDLELRVPDLGDDPALVAARRAVNGLLDATDAFVRESGASLEYASQARFFRRFLVRGMRGSFRHGAVTINEATSAMAETHGRLQAEHVKRQELADGFESAVLGLSDSVAAAATQMESTARSLSETAQGTAGRAGTAAESSVVAREAVTIAAAAVEELVSSVGAIETEAETSNRAGVSAAAEAEQARVTMRSLSGASQEIGQVVHLINQVAGQTRLLALNATIEAARAGEAGKGFAVVASEVKNLAAQTATATERIAVQVEQIQGVTAEAVQAIENVTGSVRGMGENLAFIASSVAEQRQATTELSMSTSQAATAVMGVSDEVTAIGSDTESTSLGAVEMTAAALELSRLSSSLRTEVAHFLSEIR